MQDINYYLYIKVQHRVRVGVLIYLLSTLILYYIGPFKWITRSPIYFLLINLAYIVAITFGMRLGAFSRKHYSKWSNWNDKKLLNRLLPLTIINCIMTLVNMARGFGLSSLNFSALISRIVFGFADVGAGYMDAIIALEGVSGADLIGGSFFTLLNFLWQFFDFNIVLLDIYYYKKSSRLQKLFTGLLIIETGVRYVAVGTNIGVFRVLVSIVVIYACKLLRDFLKTNKSGYENYIIRKKVIKIKMLSFVAFAMIIFFFIKTMIGRAGGNYIWGLDTYNIGGIYLNPDCILFKIFPQDFFMPIIMICGYLTQGYYGLALCLELPWKPMLGLGSSMGIVDMLTNHGIDINSLTFQQRAEELYGWSSRVQWASIYTWFANDVSFIGVILVMFIIGILFSRILKDALLTDNPFATCLFTYMVIMVFFIPCNNQIIQTTYMLFGFAYLLFRWITTTRVRIII